MDLKYILNEKGEKTAVIIPIEEWRQILDLHEDLQDADETSGTENKRWPDVSNFPED
ncbi:hypothetical protein [Dyadobacter psychrotolerans]|uniref:hypothetical protein n=1 Tax=Dyadobacter psychrotolerans TaxID=2541721 RepID=UPI001404D87F|nr:hypothetical protein [Dyadobacter psychrotolerans]